MELRYGLSRKFGKILRQSFEIPDGNSLLVFEQNYFESWKMKI